MDLSAYNTSAFSIQFEQIKFDAKPTLYSSSSTASHSCRLLWLNSGARGEHLTSQLSWVVAWLLVTHVCPVYLADDLVLIIPYGWANSGSVDVFLRMVSMVLVFFLFFYSLFYVDTNFLFLNLQIVLWI